MRRPRLDDDLDDWPGSGLDVHDPEPLSSDEPVEDGGVTMPEDVEP